MTAAQTVIKSSVSVESQHLLMADNTCFANMLASFTGSERITAHHSFTESPFREGDELEGPCPLVVKSPRRLEETKVWRLASGGPCGSATSVMAPTAHRRLGSITIARVLSASF
jgi:hypothetical protein